jgi:uncharacterized integral membrane protein
MISLVLLLILASGIAFFSQQNTMLVTVSFLQYSVPNLPLFYVMIASMLVGIFLAYIVHIGQSISTALTISEKTKKNKKLKQTLLELVKKNHQLELENVRLKKDSDQSTSDDKAL